MTLIELMVALGAASVVMAGVLGVYFFAASQWDTGAADVEAFTTAAEGMERMCQDIEKGRSASIMVLPDGRELLRVRLLPSAITDAGIDYFPDSSDTSYSMPPPEEYWFYLSDTTGQTIRNGDILWRAYMPIAASTQIDPEWSLYYDSGKGRVSGVTGLDFSIDSSDDIVYVTMTVKGTEGQKEASRSLSRWVHMRSHDD
jgi:hypothetical protein